jgi:hypothetical protein
MMHFKSVSHLHILAEITGKLGLKIIGVETFSTGITSERRVNR